MARSVPAPSDSTPSDSTAPSTESSDTEDQSQVTPSGAADTSDEGRIPRVVVGIDSTVEQGNRVTLTTPNLKTDPIGDLKNRIKEHFDEATVVVAELRATIDELDALLNKVRTGL